jgi:hypothetical protein
VRYHRNSELVTITGFTSGEDADHYIQDMQSDQRRGRWIDPADGRMKVQEWAQLWIESIDVERRTVENYEGALRNHIVPRWGDTAIGEITALDVSLWRKALRQRYASSTVNGHMCVFSMMLEDAVDQRMIEANPVHRKRRRVGGGTMWCHGRRRCGHCPTTWCGSRCRRACWAARSRNCW